MNERGFQLDKTNGAVADYIAKFGREPSKVPWGAAAELTKAHLKSGRSDEHLIPFAMLALIAQGCDELKAVFLEYTRWFKGKHQLVWSAGLRSILLENPDEKSEFVGESRRSDCCRYHLFTSQGLCARSKRKKLTCPGMRITLMPSDDWYSFSIGRSSP